MSRRTRKYFIPVYTLIGLLALTSFVLALLILLLPAFGSYLNSQYLLEGNFSNRVAVADMLIGIAGFSGAAVGITAAVEVILKGQIEGILLDLALMRSQGVAIRNQGNAHLDDEDYDDWKACYLEWHQKLISKASELTPMEGEWLTTLDKFPTWNFPNVERKEQVQLLREATATLERIDRLLQQYRPSTAVKLEDLL